MQTQTRSDDYRAHAEECQAQADRAQDPGVKRAYEKLARQWRELAEQADKHGS
jgi:hypothetical protein